MNILPALRDHLQGKFPDQKWDVVGMDDEARMLMSAVGRSGYIVIEQKDNLVCIILQGTGVLGMTIDNLNYHFTIDLYHPDFLSKIRMAVRKCIRAEDIYNKLRQQP